MRVIGIMGLKGSGKSEGAGRLVVEHSFECSKRLGFDRAKCAAGFKTMRLMQRRGRR